MKKTFFIYLSLIASILFASCGGYEGASISRAGIMSEDYVEEKLMYPEEVVFSDDIRGEDLGNNKFKVLRKFTAKNTFGVKCSYVYKAIMVYSGNGEWVEPSNWTCTELVIEDVATGKQYR